MPRMCTSDWDSPPSEPQPPGSETMSGPRGKRLRGKGRADGALNGTQMQQVEAAKGALFCLSREVSCFEPGLQGSVDTPIWRDWPCVAPPLALAAPQLLHLSTSPSHSSPTLALLSHLQPVPVPKSLVYHTRAHPSSAFDPIASPIGSLVSFHLNLTSTGYLLPHIICHSNHCASSDSTFLSSSHHLTSTMSADTSDLSKVDSAIAGVDADPVKAGAKDAKRRTTSSAPGVMNIAELGEYFEQLHHCPR